MAADTKGHVPGFLRACWDFRTDIFKSWDFAASLAVVVVVMIVPSDDQVRKGAGNLATSAVAVSTALVGVVVAGLAVVVAFLDAKFAEELDKDTSPKGGIAGELFPFWFVTATGVADVLLGTLLFVTYESLLSLALRSLCASVAGLLTWTALGVFNLVAGLQALGVSRVIFLRNQR